MCLTKYIFDILILYPSWGTLLVAQLVEALRNKSEGRGFDSRRCNWNFSLTQSFRLHFGPRVDSASKLLVEALRYKSKGCEFDSPWCHWNFSFDIILPAVLWPWGWLNLLQKWVPGIFPAGKGGRCVGLTTLSPSCADCFEIWDPQPSGNLRACPGL